jgi:hypothetical protein
MFLTCSAQPPVVHAERFEPPLARPELLEAGFVIVSSVPLAVSQLEFDERRRFVRVVDLGIDGVRMPCVREQPLWLDLLHHGFPLHVFVPG